MNARITILGCGNSTGVPAIGNHWGACDPDEPRNRRLRASILVQSGETALVVDTGPDFREQINRTGIKTVNAVLYSHAHGDHAHGIDDLRVIRHRNGALVPVYGNAQTLKELKERFHYMFEGGNHALYPPILQPQAFAPEDFGRIHRIGDIGFIPFEQDHGSCISVGYRFGDTGYSPDMKTLDAKAIDTLKGVKTWIADCAAYKDNANSVHASLDAVFEMNRAIGAERVYLTSLSVAMDYETLKKEIPEGYEPCHDSLSFKSTL